MDIFNVTHWEPSKIGDKNAEQLCNNSAIKNVHTKSNSNELLHSNKNKGNRKRIRKLKIDMNKSKQDVCFNLRKDNGERISNKIKINSAVPGLFNKKVAKHNRNSNKVINKSLEEDANAIFKQKKKRSNKQKQLIEKETVIPNTKGKKKEIEIRSDATKMQNQKIKLLNMLKTPATVNNKAKSGSLKERMVAKLKASRFRYINEQIYSSESKDIQMHFKNDPDAFRAYHEGYQQQVSKWALNPLDIIINSVKRMPNDYVIADMGCGDARLARLVPQKVHSFDFVALNKYVTACDMRHVCLENESIDVVVFCLSLMGNNIREFLFEANRILRKGGLLKIAEVESRFETVDLFVEGVKQFGFIHTWKDLSHKLFYFLDFKKASSCKPLRKLPTISLHPCLYKKR